MTSARAPRSLITIGVVLGASTGAVLAGPLDPPAGPIAPTQKSLADVEARIAVNQVNTPSHPTALFNITQPGSYYLTGNVTGVAGAGGIRIAVSNVTLDLNGFTVTGVPGTSEGITLVGPLLNVTIRNGTVNSWGGSGVILGGAGGVLENVVATFNGLNGIVAQGFCTVSRCVSHQNVQAGFVVGTGGVVTDCVSGLNGGAGFAASDGCALNRCSARNNGGSGFITGNSSSLTGCVSAANTLHGFLGNSDTSFSACSAAFNQQSGFALASSCSLVNCVSASNSAHGFTGLNNLSFSACSAGANGQVGFNLQTTCTIADCSALNNTLDGILVVNACLVRANTCDSNGFGAGNGAGIHLASFDNRVEGNNCINNDRGVDADAGGNFIARNTCSTNAVNWDVATGNVCLVVNAATAGAILGNAGGTAPGSTDPSANFTY